VGVLIFGSLAVAAMLVFYALEERSPWFVLAFAGACAASAAYGVMIEAWPFAAIEAVWSVIALRRWWRRAGSSHWQLRIGTGNQEQGAR
jgi:hypothetical protein